MVKIRKFIIGLGVLTTLSGCNFFRGLESNVEADGFLYVKTNATLQEVLDSLRPQLKDIASFQKYAESKNYSQEIKPGKYKLEKGETNSSLLDKLRDGKQEEVPLMIKNEPTIFHLAGSVSKKIEADSAEIVQAIIDWANQQDKGLNAETVKQYFIPNTYNYWWASSGEIFVEKMIREFDKVWTEERARKAQSMNMTQLEVFTLASIVQ